MQLDATFSHGPDDEHHLVSVGSVLRTVYGRRNPEKAESLILICTKLTFLGFIRSHKNDQLFEAGFVPCLTRG
jgi:hypothetical protein